MAQEGNVQVNGISIPATAFVATEAPDTSLQNPLPPDPPVVFDPVDNALNGDGVVAPTLTQEGVTVIA